MTRQPNAVDFWRGFALITIFIDHIPGLSYDKYTLTNFSVSDAADLFVFLAGWSLRLMADGGGRRMPTRDVVLRLFGRALELYAAQILITMLAIAMLAITATELQNPLLLQWHNAASVFDDPVPTHVGLALLTHQLGYFDILPLYVVLMLMAPFFAVIDRLAPTLVLPASAVLYFSALVFQLTLPTWPVSGTWFFNPLAWQFTFVLGFVLARADVGPGAWVRRHIVGYVCLALPILIYFTLAVLVRLVLGSDRCAKSAIILSARQGLGNAASTDSISSARSDLLDRLPLYSPVWRTALSTLCGHAIDSHARNARPQLTLCVLHWLTAEPRWTSTPLLLPRLCRQ